MSRAGYVPKGEAAAQERAGATRELLFPDHRCGHRDGDGHGVRVEATIFLEYGENSGDT